MTTFTYSVSDNFFPQVFTGTQEAASKEELYNELVEVYTMELDTVESELTITIEEVKPAQTVHLQYVGDVPAVEASELREGDVRMFNFGTCSTVIKVLEKSAKTLTVITVNEEGNYYMSDIRKSTLVAIVKRDQDVSSHNPTEVYNVSGKNKGMVNVSEYFQTKEVITEESEEFVSIESELNNEVVSEYAEVETVTEEVNVATTYQTNTGKNNNGIEISFNGKPSEDVRNQLKAHGFRWNRTNKVWWTIETPERLEFTQSICNQSESTNTNEPITYPDININDLDSDTYIIPQSLQDREHDAHWITRTTKTDHNKVLSDLFNEYQTKVMELINLTDNEHYIFKLKDLLQRFKKKYHQAYINYLTSKANQPSWVVTGRGGLNTSRYNKMIERQNKAMSEVVSLPSQMDQTISKYTKKIRKEAYKTA